MSEKLKVGILGATGMVGQRFISLLENHPWFEVVTLAASARSAGKTYEEAVGGRWKMDTPMPEAVKNLVVMNVSEVEKVASTVDFVFSAVDMSKEEIKAIEEEYAKTETPVVSNNSAHRWTPDVPMVVPEINPQHFEVIKYQKERLGTKRGFVAVKPNCSIQSYAPVLTAWKEFEPYEVVATTYQAISGAGKTFTMQTMALRMRRKGIQVFIIAPLKGHEFYRACKNVGGEFIQISPASRNCINIMEIRKIDNSVNELLDGPTMDASALASKIQKLHIFFSLLIPDMTHEEKQLLDEALIKTYALKGITHKNESLIDPKHPDQYKPMPILEDVYNVLLESDDTKRLAHILNRLVHGSASSFNQQTNVDLSNKYTVLDISELTGSSDLLTVGMFVALDYVWDKAKENRTEEKAVFVDEVWQLIGASSNRLAAEFVLEIAKVIRAYSGAGIFATQDLNDFFALDDGKYGKGIINNCKTKIILNMEDEEAQRVKNILHLSETEVMNITHFQRGNGLISTNNNNITVEFKASTLEKELITTDRQELLEIIERQKRRAG